MHKFKWNDLHFSDEEKQEIRILIENEKNPENELSYSKIEEDIISSLDIDPSNNMSCYVIDYKRNIKYDFKIHKTKIADRFSIGLMNLTEGNFLLRFDYGSTLRHKNNIGCDNEYTVVGAHIHVWAKTDKYSNKNVIPIENTKDFRNIYHISEVFDKVITVSNIRRRC